MSWLAVLKGIFVALPEIIAFVREVMKVWRGSPSEQARKVRDKVRDELHRSREEQRQKARERAKQS